MSTLITRERQQPGAQKSAALAARLAAAARSSSQAQVVIGGTVLLFLLPALVDVLASPARPYGYLAADAFYYFTIGANWAELGAPSFDQTHPTNGFHPLWQWTIALVSACLHGLGFPRLALVPVAVVACLLMLSLAILLLGLARVKDGRISPLFVMLPMGAWPLLISPVWWDSREKLPAYDMLPLFGTLWNFSNGLESALLLLTFAVVAWLYVKRPADSVPRALAFGVALAALSFARLDHAVFALTLAGLPFAYHLMRRDRSRALLALWTLLAWLSALGLYLAYNRAAVGRFMPVSGAVKSTFPHLDSASLDALLGLPTYRTRQLMFVLGRIGSLAFPALLALLYFPFALRLRSTLARASPVLREGHARFSQLMLLTAVGIVALTTYDLLFVVHFQIGEWYAPISVLFVSLFAVQVGERLAQEWPFSAGRWLGWGLVLVLSAVELSSFWKLHRLLPWGSDYATFCLGQAPRVVARYAAGAAPRVLSRDDGIVGFATGFPTTSGTRLALDPEAVEASAAGRFEELLAERGVDRVTSQHYLQATGFRVGERSPRVQRFAEQVLMAPPLRTYEVEYVDRSFGILRALPRERVE